MKKIISDLFNKYSESILSEWFDKAAAIFKGNVSDEEIKRFGKDCIALFSQLVTTKGNSVFDQFLENSYDLFSKAKLNLLEISQIFNLGRNAVINHLNINGSDKFDPLIVIGFLDELIETVFARFSMFYQEKKTKELTENLENLASQLEQNQQYLQNILQASDAAIMVIDRNEKIVAWNKGAEKIFGYTQQEIIGKPSSYLIPSDEEHRDELNYIRDEVNKKGSLENYETERKTKTGEKIPVQLNVTKLQNSTGKYYGRTVIIKDVTEVKRLQQQIDQSEKLAVIGQLAAGVAHEIGNPLTSISSLVQILQRRSTDLFVKEQLSNIKENIDRISKIVRELVDLSRPPSNVEEVTQINDIIKTALGIVKYDKRVKEVSFETNLDEKSPFIKIVPDQLVQVFINILINALDAIEGCGKIKVISSHDEKNIYVDIIDNGCGIESKNIDKIFNPFFTTKEVGKGTGLGLAISYNIVKKVGGDIKVSSTLNKGSKFSVILPINTNEKEN